jgi:hypothetical protein
VCGCYLHYGEVRGFLVGRPAPSGAEEDSSPFSGRQQQALKGPKFLGRSRLYMVAPAAWC